MVANAGRVGSEFVVVQTMFSSFKGRAVGAAALAALFLLAACE
jgi:hypothetical protein